VEKRAAALKAARSIFAASVLPKLGHRVVEQLTSDQINRWRHDLAASGKRVRTKKFADKPPPVSDEERRKRRATSNRVLTMLKAALNRAYRAGRRASMMNFAEERSAGCLSGRSTGVSRGFERLTRLAAGIDGTLRPAIAVLWQRQGTSRPRESSPSSNET
jgi:hypothetical protein